MRRHPSLISRLIPSRRSPAARARTQRRRALFLEQLEARSLLATFTVVNVDDAGAGSLRQAILDANASPAFDEIHFNIPGPGVHTIALETLLPDTHSGGPISIDATTQPGFDYAGPRLIELISGENFSHAANQAGLSIGSSNSLVRGLAISGFYNSITVHNGSNVRIESNYLGLDPSGASTRPRVYELEQMNGLRLSATSNTIVGGTTEEARNVISGNFVGIQLMNGATNNQILGNYLGTDATGISPLANQRGIHLFGHNPDNRVGMPGHGNLIVGSEAGVHVQSASDNVIQANSIGYNINGVGIGEGGIELQHGANGNLIGGNTVAARNLIRSVVVRYGAHDNVVQGNYIGVDPTGMQRNHWGQGVLIGGSNTNEGGHSNIIGTDGDGVNDMAEGNLIANGVVINGAGSTNNVVAGNLIGTDATGMAALVNNPPTLSASNLVGISIQAAAGNWIGTNGDGNSDEAERNIIAGGFDIGVRTALDGAEQNVIAGNFIGTNKSGDAALGNRVGVSLGGRNNRLGTDGDGENDEAERNVISGNTEWGVDVGGAGSAVAGNYIGVDASGLAALGNGVGIRLLYTGGTIGGSDPALRNVISGNIKSGIDTLNAREYAVVGNYIGVDKTGSGPLGNGGDGVWLRFNSFNNTIGGTTPGAANIIANNGRNGVSVSEGPRQFFDVETASENSIRGNSIYANTGLGIDLGRYAAIGVNETPVIIPGVTPNDAADSDAGPNGFQNFPVLSVATWGASTRVQGILHSTPNSTLVVDFYANASADPSGYGEGQRWLGTVAVTTDGDGNAAFNSLLSAATSFGEFLSATATDVNGNTSEFSAVVQALIPNNTPPTADAGEDQTRNQGDVVAFDATGSSDADGSIVQYAWDFGDGTSYTETAADAPDGSFDGRTTHLYTDNGEFTVALTVSDNNAATAVDTAGVTIQNVAPTVDAGPDLSLLLGGEVTLNGTFSDPGQPLGEIYLATIDWGDGETTAGVVDVEAGTVTGSHTYADAGNYTVSLTVTDNGDPAPSQTATPLSGSDTTGIVVVRPVLVHIQPESLNVDSNGTITVAIFGAADFAASLIDVGSVRFAGASAWQSTLTDVNGDGHLDLQLKFRTQETILDQIYTQLLEDDVDVDGILDSTRQVAEIAVTGLSQSGTQFSGSDELTLFLSGRALRELLDDLFG